MKWNTLPLTIICSGQQSNKHNGNYMVLTNQSKKVAEFSQHLQAFITIILKENK